MRNLEGHSKNDYETDQYEVMLTFLGYDSESSKLSFPMQVRERHLTPGPSEATLQGIGPELQITVWSNRENIVVRLPFKDWRATRSYSGTLTGKNNGILSVGRFEDDLETMTHPDADEQVVTGFLWTHDRPRPGDDE